MISKIKVSDRRSSRNVGGKKNQSRESERMPKVDILEAIQSSKSVPEQDRSLKIEIGSKSSSDAEQVAKSVVLNAKQAAEQKSVYSIPVDIYLLKYLEDIKDIMSRLVSKIYH